MRSSTVRKRGVLASDTVVPPRDAPARSDLPYGLRSRSGSPGTGTEHRRAQLLGVAAPVELGGPAAVARGPAAGRDQEAIRAGDLAVEVAGVERGAPDDLVHPAELGHGELGRAEGGGERGVLQ